MLVGCEVGGKVAWMGDDRMFTGSSFDLRGELGEPCESFWKKEVISAVLLTF